MNQQNHTYQTMLIPLLLNSSLSIIYPVFPLLDLFNHV